MLPPITMIEFSDRSPIDISVNNESNNVYCEREEREREEGQYYVLDIFRTQNVAKY